MDITNVNFIERLPLILKSLETADFIAQDTEFSGLSVGFEDKDHDYDTLESKYQKFMHICRRMNAFQIGIATFKWDASKNEYVIRPFNFYVWPNSTMMDKQIMQFDVSSVKFLMQNHFDFNKLFREGISYQRLADKELVESRLARHLNESPPFHRQSTRLGTRS